MLFESKKFDNLFHISLDYWSDRAFLNGQSFPVGYFAAEILNAEERFLLELEKLSDAIRQLSAPLLFPTREDLCCLLPAVRENVLSLVHVLCRIPPFTLWDMEVEIQKIENVFGDNAVDALSEMGLARAIFLRYIEDTTSISTAIKHFWDVGRFLEENYLRHVENRDESDFAAAAHACFNSADFSELLNRHGMDIETFSFSPKLRSTCTFAHDPKNKSKIIFVNTLSFDSYMDFFTYDLLNGMHYGHAPSKCRCCGRYFLTVDKHRPKYCNGMAPQNPHYTCRQFGAMNQQKEKNANHPVFQIYKTRTNTIRKHHQRGKISDELRQAAIAVCEELRDKALFDTKFAEKRYLQLMEQDAVYAEARKRLGDGEIP